MLISHTLFQNLGNVSPERLHLDAMENGLNKTLTCTRASSHMAERVGRATHPPYGPSARLDMSAFHSPWQGHVGACWTNALVLLFILARGSC